MLVKRARALNSTMVSEKQTKWNITARKLKNGCFLIDGFKKAMT